MFIFFLKTAYVIQMLSCFCLEYMSGNLKTVLFILKSRLNDLKVPQSDSRISYPFDMKNVLNNLKNIQFLVQVK